MGFPQCARIAANGEHRALTGADIAVLCAKLSRGCQLREPARRNDGVADALRTSYIDGFVVSYRGRVVFEWYAHGLTPDTPHLIFSVSKSIAGTMGGILADRGKLDVDAPVTRYIPEMKGSVYGDGCAVRHLLDMSVGIRFDEDYMAREGDVITLPALRRMGAAGRQHSADPSAPYLQTLRPDGTAARPHLPLCVDQHRRARMGL